MDVSGLVGCYAQEKERVTVMGYATTNFDQATYKQAAEQDDSLLFLSIIAHYLHAPKFDSDKDIICKTGRDSQWEYGNLLENALFNQQGHSLRLDIDDWTLSWSGSAFNPSWEVPVPSLLKELLEKVEQFGDDRPITLGEFEPVWENWLAYHDIQLSPELYENF
jgi:hypothetical protein